MKKYFLSLIFTAIILLGIVFNKSYAVGRDTFSFDYGVFNGIGLHYSTGIFASDLENASFNLRFSASYNDLLHLNGDRKYYLDSYNNVSSTGQALESQYTVNRRVINNISYISSLVDWYPGRNGFRVSFGLAYNNSQFSQKYTTSNALVKINGVDAYRDIETETKLRFTKAAVYLGIGYGINPRFSKGFSFSFSLGVYYQDKPALKITSVAKDSDSYQATMQQKETEAVNSFKKLRYYSDISKEFIPNVSIGFEYKI